MTEAAKQTTAAARNCFSKEAREAYYWHVRDNCGGWTDFASRHTAASGWEHEQAFHAARTALGQASDGKYRT